MNFSDVCKFVMCMKDENEYELAKDIRIYVAGVQIGSYCGEKELFGVTNFFFRVIERGDGSIFVPPLDETYNHVMCQIYRRIGLQSILGFIIALKIYGKTYFLNDVEMHDRFDYRDMPWGQDIMPIYNFHDSRILR